MDQLKITLANNKQICSAAPLIEQRKQREMNVSKRVQDFINADCSSSVLAALPRRSRSRSDATYLSSSHLTRVPEEYTPHILYDGGGHFSEEFECTVIDPAAMFIVDLDSNQIGNVSEDQDIIKESNEQEPVKNNSLTNGVNTQAHKKRMRASIEQLNVLGEAFARNTSPNAKIREELSRRLGMPERSIQIWFQNKRAKIKLKQRRLLNYRKMMHTHIAPYNSDLSTQLQTNSSFIDMWCTGDAQGSILLSNKSITPRMSISDSSNQTTMVTPIWSPLLVANSTIISSSLPLENAEDSLMTRLIVNSLTIGNWCRIAIGTDTLYCAFSAMERIFTWAVTDNTHAYKMEIPYATITSMLLRNIEQSQQQALHSELCMTLTVPPTFWMRVRSKPALTNPEILQSDKVTRKASTTSTSTTMVWIRCRDFTENRQAETHLIHRIQGALYPLRSQILGIIGSDTGLQSIFCDDDPLTPAIPMSFSSSLINKSNSDNGVLYSFNSDVSLPQSQQMHLTTAVTPTPGSSTLPPHKPILQEIRSRPRRSVSAPMIPFSREMHQLPSSQLSRQEQCQPRVESSMPTSNYPLQPPIQTTSYTNVHVQPSVVPLIPSQQNIPQQGQQQTLQSQRQRSLTINSFTSTPAMDFSLHSLFHLSDFMQDVKNAEKQVSWKFAPDDSINGFLNSTTTSAHLTPKTTKQTSVPRNMNLDTNSYKATTVVGTTSAEISFKHKYIPSPIHSSNMNAILPFTSLQTQPLSSSFVTQPLVNNIQSTLTTSAETSNIPSVTNLLADLSNLALSRPSMNVNIPALEQFPELLFDFSEFSKIATKDYRQQPLPCSRVEALNTNDDTLYSGKDTPLLIIPMDTSSHCTSFYPTFPQQQ